MVINYVSKRNKLHIYMDTLFEFIRIDESECSVNMNAKLNVLMCVILCHKHQIGIYF